MITEQRVLHISILVTLLLSGFGILFGLLSSSSAIVFDGIYEMTDAAMTILALLVSNLIRISNMGTTTQTKLVERFTMGFWHLEPMVLGLNGILLMGAATYALINSIDSFLTGGRYLDFNYAIIYAAISLVIEVFMAVFTLRANKKIKSEFLAVDAKAWIMTAALTVAWLFAFIFGVAIEDTKWDHLIPYIDPAILAVVCFIVIPMPFATVKKALEDILLVTPIDLKEEVDNVAREITKKYGFSSFTAYVARVGRGRQVEIYFLVPKNDPARKLEEWDKMRDEIEKTLGANTPDYWLTIVFTADPEWTDY